MSSPFSEAAVELLERIDAPAYKIASGEVDNPILLRRIVQTGKPALISSGMSDLRELERAIRLFSDKSIPVGLFQCTTAYPCPPQRVGLGWVKRLADQFKVPTGLSDHSGQIYAGLAAVTLGASMLEVHLALSDDMFGPDVPASLLPNQLEQLCKGTRDIETMRSAEPEAKGGGDDTERLRRTFGKSLTAARRIPRGNAIGWEDLTAKKPGTGIPASKASEWIGHRVTRDIAAGERFQQGDVCVDLDRLLVQDSEHHQYRPFI